MSIKNNILIFNTHIFAEMYNGVIFKESWCVANKAAQQILYSL